MPAPKPIRETDLTILAYLRTHARASLTTIARAARLPISTVHDRLKVIHELLVKRQVTHVQFHLLGYPLRCYTAFKVAVGDRSALQQYLSTHPNLNTLMHINNGYDFLAETYFPQVRDFERFLLGVAQKFRIREAKAYYVIEELAAEQFFSTPAALASLELKVP